jgi:hypothetical protein
MREQKTMPTSLLIQDSKIITLTNKPHSQQHAHMRYVDKLDPVAVMPFLQNTGLENININHSIRDLSQCVKIAFALNFYNLKAEKTMNLKTPLHLYSFKGLKVKTHLYISD